jgi:putative transposase
MISSAERQMAINLIDEAMHEGACNKKACEIIGIAQRTYQRWRSNGLIDQRQVVEKHPVNQLTEQEKQQILEISNREEFRS